jgi:hypothetical protein
MKFIYTLTLLAFKLEFIFTKRKRWRTPTITAANTIVNAYTPVTNNVIAGAGSTTIKRR